MDNGIITRETQKSRIFWWTVCVAYIAINYATLGAMPALWDSFNAFFRGRGVWVQYTLYTMTGLMVFGYLIWFKRERRISKYLILVGIIALFLMMLKLEKNPGEKIHMAQYGLFGILLFNALKVDFNCHQHALYGVGAVVCIAAGAIDEVIQGFLPNRFFTWHDVFINGLSGILALLVIQIMISQKP